MKASRLSKRGLQVVLVAIALVSVVTGLLGILPPGVASEFYGLGGLAADSGHAILDSNYRYYSGIWLGVGAVMLWIVPNIERQRTVLRVLSVLIFLGGLGRVVSAVSFTAPPPAFVFFMMLELLFPLSLAWQARVSRE